MTEHIPGDLIARTQTIAGLRALADFLEANPDIPAREYGVDYTYFARAEDDTTERAEVDHIAAALGETVTDETGRGGHYTVSKTSAASPTPQPTSPPNAGPPTPHT